MNQAASSLQVICRPALVNDHTDVVEFCRDMMEGNDYVPGAWIDWLQDPDGLLAVAEYNRHAIGCAKLSRLSEGQWWLEGFRVDPKHQGRKVGSQIHTYLTDWWLENGDGIIRLMTDAENYAVHRVCDKTGYINTHEVCGYKAVPLMEPVNNFFPVTDMSVAAAFAAKSESIRTTNGLTDFGWQIAKVNEQIFQNYSNHETVSFHTFRWWKDRQGLVSTWVDEDGNRQTLVIGVLASNLNDLPALLLDVRRLAGSMNFDNVFQIAFDMPQIVSCLENAGFEKKWKHTNAFVFEKIHPDRA